MPNRKFIEIGQRLKEWVEAGYPSIAEFARKTGKPSQFWYQYFSGKRRPGAETQDILRSVGCDIEWLMTGKKSETEPIDHPENRRMLHLLKELGIDSEDKLRALLNPQGIAEDIALVMRERMLKYQKKRGKR